MMKMETIMEINAKYIADRDNFYWLVTTKDSNGNISGKKIPIAFKEVIEKEVRMSERLVERGPLVA